MEINIERSPQHWCPSEGSNSELFAHENDALTARPLNACSSRNKKEQETNRTANPKEIYRGFHDVIFFEC